MKSKIQDNPSFQQVKFFISQSEKQTNDKIDQLAKEEDRKSDRRELLSLFD